MMCQMAQDCGVQFVQGLCGLGDVVHAEDEVVALLRAVVGIGGDLLAGEENEAAIGAVAHQRVVEVFLEPAEVVLGEADGVEAALEGDGDDLVDRLVAAVGVVRCVDVKVNRVGIHGTGGILGRRVRGVNPAPKERLLTATFRRDTLAIQPKAQVCG